MSQAQQPVSAALPRGLLILLGTAAGVITVAGIKGISGLVGPVFLALVLTIAVHPLRGWFLRRHLPGWLATLACILVVYAFLISFAVALVVATARFATLLPQYKDEMASTVQDLTSWMSHLGVGQDQIDAVANSLDLGKLAGYVGDLLGDLLGVVSNLFFIVAVLLFLALDGALFSRRLAEAPPERAPVVAALRSFAVGTRRYLLVSTVFGLIVAVLDAIALWLLGIPAPVLWGLLAFLTNYIPNVGFIIGLLPVAVLGLLEGGPGLGLAVVVIYSLINVVIQSVIQPKVIGDAVGLSTTLTFLSLVFWAWVLGALGALLAIPLSLLVKALLIDIDPSARWLLPLIGGGGSSPEVESAPGAEDTG